MTHSFDPNVQPAEEDDDEQIYYDWARRSVSGAYIGKTWKAPKKWRPVTNTDEEKAILMESGKVRVEGQSADVHVGSYVLETYNSSSTEEANINSRVEEMTTWVADHMVIPRLNSFRRTTPRPRSPSRSTAAAAPSVVAMDAEETLPKRIWVQTPVRHLSLDTSTREQLRALVFDGNHL